MIPKGSLNTNRSETRGITMNPQELENDLVKTAVAPRVTLDGINALIVKEEFYIPEGTCLTICILTLKNGFTVTGESACVNKENYRQDIGEKLARERAVNQIWPLEGYALANEMIKFGGSFTERMKAEYAELKDKYQKLGNFITGSIQFQQLPPEERKLLHKQYEIMTDYLEVLRERIAK